MVLNSSGLDKFPLKDAVWKLNMGGYDKLRKISCAEMEINILTVKKRQNN